MQKNHDHGLASAKAKMETSGRTDTTGCITFPTTAVSNLEDVQRRALQVIFGNVPYNEPRRTCNILSLAEHRHELGKRFFPENYQEQVERPSYLLPAKRDVQLTTRLCRARQYPTICARANRYKTLLLYLD